MSGNGCGREVPGDRGSLSDRIRAARSEGTLGELFELLVSERGRSEASRLWFAAFAETDASET